MADECKADSAKLGLFSSVLGHVGDGNFHQMIMYNPNKPEDVAAVKKFVDGMMQKAVEMEGTVSVIRRPPQVGSKMSLLTFCVVRASMVSGSAKR
jgi:FAD/FMN-containing dehydrogenase